VIVDRATDAALDGCARRVGSAPKAVQVWSTPIGTERFATVSTGSSLRRSQVRSWGNRPTCRTLIRMRSQVQVLAGPPAKPPRQSVVGFPVTTLSLLAEPASSCGGRIVAASALSATPRHPLAWSAHGPAARDRPRRCTVLTARTRHAAKGAGIGTPRGQRRSSIEEGLRGHRCTPCFHLFHLASHHSCRPSWPRQEQSKPRTQAGNLLAVSLWCWCGRKWNWWLFRSLLHLGLGGRIHRLADRESLPA
jgi:hypothetical protein